MLTLNIENKNFDAVIGISSYAKYYADFQEAVPIGTINVNLISAKPFNFTDPYPHFLSSKKVGVVFGVGFEQLLPDLQFDTYDYAQQGIIKLSDSAVELIIEDPLVIKCVSKSVLKRAPNIRELFIYSPPVLTTPLYIGLRESDRELINSIKTTTEMINVDMLKKSYSKNCENESKLQFREIKKTEVKYSP